jgi:hypothetical protein
VDGSKGAQNCSLEGSEGFAFASADTSFKILRHCVLVNDEMIARILNAA